MRRPRRLVAVIDTGPGLLSGRAVRRVEARLMFQILWSLIAGLVIGALARLLLPGKQAIPVWLTMLLGVAGAFLGNGVASWIGVRHTGGVDWIRHILQIGVAMALISALAPVWANRGKTKNTA